MKLINAEPILQRMAEEEVSGKGLRRMIREADQIDLILCRDCKHCLNYERRSCRNWCAEHECIVDLDDYCSRGERYEQTGSES